MRYDVLKNYIFNLQKQYKELLIKLLPNLRLQNAYSSLDEINIFWYSNMDAVKMYLHYVISNNDSYVFTASTFMDIGDNEHYPFLLLGKMHILDDPLSKYSVVLAKEVPGNFNNRLKEQIVLIATDNIRILEECDNKILVLPLRLLSQSNEHMPLYLEGEKAFISLFKGIKDIKDYFLKCNTWNDILKYVRDDIGNIIIFTENDDITKPFVQRFQNAVHELEYMFEENSTDAHKFFILVYGYIQQSVDVLMSCVEYNCIPYLRNMVSFNYFMLLSDSFKELPIIPDVRYKCCIAHLIYRLYNKEKFECLSVNTFYQAALKLNFQGMLFDSLAQAKVSAENFSPNKIAPSIEMCFEKLYDTISSR
ncbi:hypothetical protein ACHOLT_04690 [Desulfitobacterium sp. Sab5]|uniref:hypothetical protein n=1 Tax=Desulfitobacterium nosdiversum TaxID=3375356 RepID=UPI003CF97531